MIELFEQDIRTNDRQSSKGNQLKWKSGGYWYKADYTGYEGLAEYVISALLQKSTLTAAEFVSYHPEQICYKTRTFCGAKSADFLRDGWQIVTLERLFKNFFNESLTQALWKIPDVSERFRFLVSQVERITGWTDFAVYLNKLFTIDAMFLNEDRHMHNVAVLMDGQGNFQKCPFFDHGAGLLADTQMDYPMDADVVMAIPTVQAKSISTSFDEQLDVSEAACGNQLMFSFSKKDVQTIVQAADCYPPEVRNRVEEILFQQMRKYGYLIQN